MVPEVGAWAEFYANDTADNTLGMHNRPSARAALVMAADEFHAGGLSAPEAAVGHRLIQISDDN
jgi:hypothetical protein